MITVARVDTNGRCIESSRARIAVSVKPVHRSYKWCAAAECYAESAGLPVGAVVRVRDGGYSDGEESTWRVVNDMPYEAEEKNP